MFYHGINNFRALSIFLIVFGHCFWISNWYPDKTWQNVYLYMIPGGTFFFAFISGFLFAHLNVSTFRYADFIARKWRNIASPYLWISVPVICFAVVVQYPGYFVDSRDGFYYQYLLPFFKYLLTGRVFTGYWYIPFILLVFAISPLLVRFYHLSSRVQLMMVAVLLLLAMFVHRAEDNLNPLQSFVCQANAGQTGHRFGPHLGGGGPLPPTARAAHTRLNPVQHVGKGRQARDQIVLLPNHPNPRAKLPQRARAHVANTLPQHLYLARTGVCQPDQAFQKRGLARPIRANDRKGNP